MIHCLFENIDDCLFKWCLNQIKQHLMSTEIKFSQAKYIPTLYPSFAQLNEKM